MASLSDAVRRRDVDAVRSALATIPASEGWPRDSDGHTPLHWAAMSKNITILESVLSGVSSIRSVDVRSIAEAQLAQTPLHWACVDGNIEAVSLLLSYGADPAAVDGKGFNAATHAVHYGRIDLLCLLFKADNSLVSSVDAEGHTLLQWAAYYDHFPAVAYLLRVWKVDPDVQDNTGMTALHRAAQKDRVVIVEMLLRAGATVKCENSHGKTPMDLADGGSKTRHFLKLWEKGVLTVERPVRPRHSMQNYGFVLFYYVLAVTSYIKYRWALMEGVVLGFHFNLFMHLFLVLSATSHMIVVLSDPGDIPKGSSDSFVAYIEQALADGTSEVQLVPAAYCFTCLVPRPPRSKHSPERDCCVKVFDHECPWVNNTVGLYNHKTLLLMVLSTAILEWMFIYAMVRFLIESPEVSSWGSAFIERPSVCVFIMVHCAVSCFCFMLFVTHARLILRGRTTYEHIVAMREKQTRNPYDMGVCKNLISFLTSSGPGTGKSVSPLSVATLQEVVLAGGSDIEKKGYALVGNQGHSSAGIKDTEALKPR